MSLDKLMKKLANGDKSAFDRIYVQTYKAVYYIALSVVRDKSAAEDVMQNVFLNVIRKASSYRSGDVRAWIARIAYNEALSERRRQSRVDYVDENENLSVFGSVQTDDYGLLTDLARRILDDDEFAILMLVTAEGYKRREIAEILSMPVGTVTWKYNNALSKLRNVLKDVECGVKI